MKMDIPETLRAVTGDAVRPGGLVLTENAVRFCGFTGQSRIGDIGCGFGATLGYLRHTLGCRAFGIDLSFHMLSGIKETPVVQASATSLPLGGNVFDGLFCECILSLVPAPDLALSEFNRVLCPSGYLIVSDIYLRHPEADPESIELSGYSCLQGAVSPADLISWVTGLGLDPILWEDHSSHLNALAAQLTWKLGSRDALMQIFFPDGCRMGCQARIQKSRPGYFLMIAQKRGSACHE